MKILKIDYYKMCKIKLIKIFNVSTKIFKGERI